MPTALGEGSNCLRSGAWRMNGLPCILWRCWTSCLPAWLPACMVVRFAGAALPFLAHLSHASPKSAPCAVLAPSPAATWMVGALRSAAALTRCGHICGGWELSYRLLYGLPAESLSVQAETPVHRVVAGRAKMMRSGKECCST